MQFTIIPVNIDSTSAVFTTNKNKIGYVFKDFNLIFHSYNDASSFLSLLLFHISQSLEGDPKKLFSLFKSCNGNKLLIRRHYHQGVSSVDHRTNAADIILNHHVIKNRGLQNKLFPTLKNDQFAPINWTFVRPKVRSFLLNRIEKTVIKSENHWALNECYNYDDESLISYTFRIGHNLTLSENPRHPVFFGECIPVYPLDTSGYKGQVQYISKYMSMLPPLPTSSTLNGQDIIRQNMDLYNKYGETILELIKTGKLYPIIYSLFIKDKYLVLSEDKIKSFLANQHKPTVLSITDELVKFAQEEEEALGHYLYNELIKLPDKLKDNTDN